MWPISSLEYFSHDSNSLAVGPSCCVFEAVLPTRELLLIADTTPSSLEQHNTTNDNITTSKKGHSNNYDGAATRCCITPSSID